MPIAQALATAANNSKQLLSGLVIFYIIVFMKLALTSIEVAGPLPDHPRMNITIYWVNMITHISKIVMHYAVA